MASLINISRPLKLVTLLLTIMLSLSSGINAQVTIPGKTYPFNINYLAYCSAEVQQNHMVIPVYRDGAFVYLNRRTGQALFRKKFQEAYPFVRGYGLVKTNGLYGIINTKGMYVIKLKYPEFKLNQRFGGARIVFRNDTAFGFDYILKAEVPYLNKDYRMPPFSAVKIGKEVALYYEFNSQSGSLNKPLLFCDSILGSTYDQAIIMKGGKIGAVNPKGETVIPFEYTEYNTNPYLSPDVYGPSPLVNMPIHFALSKGQDWYYYHEGKFLFESPIKAVEYNDNYFKYQQNGLYNYFNNKGEPMLKRNYQWLYGNSLALTTDDRLVFLLSDGKEVQYY